MMCGISGYLVNSRQESAKNLVAMSGAIGQRGPDDEGFMFADIELLSDITFASPRSPLAISQIWPTLPSSHIVPYHQIGMAQVRYSIIDLSPGGHQPMWSTCGNVCLTFNGEIYNYIELRQKLLDYGFSFKTQSDTEVLLLSYLAWGEAAFSQLNGFFAIAIYDKRHQAILLARDRLGKAHLYLTRHSDHSVYWASEIKALLAIGCINRKNINLTAIADFVFFNHRDWNGTFWADVEDFPPGHFAWINLTQPYSPCCYWRLPSKRWKSEDLSRMQAVKGLTDLLGDALCLRLRADVPVGFELSGGMDSSALVGLTAGLLGKKFPVYTIRFNESYANEEPFARMVADYYPDQIDYRVIEPKKSDFWEEANIFVWTQEEPFHSPNLQTNQSLRKIIKSDGMYVVITGAAGDEMLAGYAGDYLGPFLRYLLRNKGFNLFCLELFRNKEISAPNAIIKLLLDLNFSEESQTILIKKLKGEFGLLKSILSRSIITAPLRSPATIDESSFHGRTAANMTYRLMNYWLRSGFKSDYGIPIETRAPFLDYRVVEYCTQLPPEYLITNGWHKHILRLVSEKYLPPNVVWRQKKMGFPFPYREWLVASRAIAEKNVRDTDCPFVNINELFLKYDNLVKTAPMTLWRLLSLLLWWKRVIENQNLTLI